MRTRTLLAAFAMVVLSSPVASVATGAPHASSTQEDEARYIVHFRSDAVSAELSLRGRHSARAQARAVERVADDIALRHRVARGDSFSRAFAGVVVTASATAIADLRSDPRVEFVEREQEVELVPVSMAPDAALQRNAGNWGLDRIDQRTGLDGKFETKFDGSGVDIYVIDTGVYGRHKEFKRRMSRGRDFTVNGNAPGNKDCHSHGTHVASIAAGRNWGVAPGAQVVPLKVFPQCSGRGSSISIVGSLEWVLKNHDRSRGGVVNMSLAFGGDSPSTRAAIKKLYDAGIATAVAAGNDDIDACTIAPANSEFAMTAGASDHTLANRARRDDMRASFSNHGECVDIFAPGTSIEAAGIHSRIGTSWKSGTSMASPFVAGAIALLMERRPDWTPAQLQAEIEKFATKKSLKKLPRGTVNRLLYAVPENYRGQ